MGCVLFILFCTITLIQLFYYLFFFRRLAFYKPKAPTSSIDQPVSVIICARDEADNLSKFFPGVLVQEYKTTHEIVVVNDNSQDDSKYLLEEFKKTFRSIRIVELTQEAKLISGKKYPLFTGIKAAKYETLLLTDADCVPASEFWVNKMQSAYKEGVEIVLGYGAYRKHKGLLNKIIRFETFHTALQYLSYALAGFTYMGVGRNLSYKRELFFKNKGFSSIIQIPSGDDDLFINQVAKKGNTAIMIDHEAHTISEPKKSWNEWMRQKYRHYTTAKYYKQSHKLLLGLYSFSLFWIWPLFVASILLHTWWIVLSVMSARIILQGIILYKTSVKLNEKDLWPYFILFDIWMFFYFLFMLPALWKKPTRNWH